MNNSDKENSFWEAMKEISEGGHAERKSHSSFSRRASLLYFVVAIAVYVLMLLIGFSQVTAAFLSFLVAFFLVAQWLIHILLCIETAVLWTKDDIETHLKIQHGGKIEGGKWKI